MYEYKYNKCIPDVTTGLGERAAETGSDTYRRREDSSPEQHRGAGAEDQRPGQPDGGVCQRGRLHRTGNKYK